MTQRPSKLMTPDLAHMILKEIGLPAEYSWVDDERYEAAQYALECMDELRRFREREPLVKTLLCAVFPPEGQPPAVTTETNAGSPYQIRLAAESVVGFKVMQ